MDNLQFDEEFIATFRAEANERLANLSEGLLSFENKVPDEESIKSLFREAHTLKGSAGMMGLEPIKRLAHRIEDILGSVQKGQLKLGQGLTDLLLETIDRIESLLPDGSAAMVADDDISDLMERLGNSCKDGDGGAGDDDGAKAEPEDEAASDKKPAKRVSRPPVAKKKQAPPDSVRKKPDPTIRVNIDKLDKLLNLMGEILVNQIGTEGQVNDLSQLRGKSRELKDLFDAVAEHVRTMRESISSDEIDSLTQKLNKAGETAADMVSSLDQAATGLKESTATHKLALKELHDSTLNVRMLPLATIFSLYPRVVRDAATSCGKQAKLKISGEKTELDKRILEQISDPLLHIIRNCVDHGIEIPSERIAAGKPEKGVVKLSAEQRGNVVDICIEDDGAGIDPEKVKAAAVAQGLVAEEDDMGIDDAVSLLFKPGFSTVEKVTDISGRGVGMDVVKNNIEKLDGSISVESVPGEGTKITVSMPITLVLITGLLVEAGGAKYVVPVSSVQEMVALDVEDIQSLGNHSGFLIRDSAVPLLDLFEAIGGNPVEHNDDKINVIVVRSGRQWLGLEVDALIGEKEIVVKPLSAFMAQHPFVSGVAILASGEIVVVLNVYEMLNSLEQGNGVSVAGQNLNIESRPADRKAVLVVEDSLVVRELQKNILEAAGYDVNTAVDGNDALLRLEKHPIDCVVTDIEMPGMDGFDLTAAIRNNEQYQSMPVVMVTSLNSEDDKKRGIEVGADAYVIKGSFDQQNLLDTIERLVA